MAPPTAPSQAVDAYPLVAAVRAVFVADAAIAAAAVAISGVNPVVRPEVAVPQDVAPYITVDLVSAVKDPDSTYSQPGVLALVQATIVTEGAETATRSTIVPLMLADVLDNDLTVAGYTVWSVEEESQRSYSDATGNVIRRYGSMTFRIKASKP